MNAFGKRSAVSGGSRPSFGVARPMKSGPGGSSASAGGDQFPPIPDLTDDLDGGSAASPDVPGGAMDRLNTRQNGSGEQASERRLSLRRPPLK